MSATIIPAYDLDRGDDLGMPFDFVLLNRTEESYDPSSPHRHNYYEIFYFENGGGEHDIDFERFAIESHSLHFVSAGQVHQVRRAPGSSGCVLLFSQDFYCLNLRNRDILYELPFLNNNHPRPVLNVGSRGAAEFGDLLGRIRQEFEASEAHREEVIRSYLNVLLLTARRHFEQRHPNATSEGTPAARLVKELRILIDSNFATVHSAAAYAGMLAVTRNHLNDVTKSILGRTVSDLIQERIMLEAKRLLAHSEQSVKEIAYTLGFDDPSYFSRFFKQHAGATPNEFRLLHSNHASS